MMLNIDSEPDGHAHQRARELERKAKEEKAKSDFKKGASREEIISRLAELSDGDDEEPVRIRYVVNDATVEKLGELLAGNPAGLLLVRDELIGWLRSFDRDGHEGTPSANFAIQAFDFADQTWKTLVPVSPLVYRESDVAAMGDALADGARSRKLVAPRLPGLL